MEMARDPRQRPTDPSLSRRRFLTAGALGLATACGRARWPAVPDEVAALHRESVVFDLHIDTLLWERFLGYDMSEHHRPLLPGSAFAWQMDLPRAREAGLDGAVLGIVVTPREVRPEQLWALKIHGRLERGHGIAQTLETLDLLRSIERDHPDAIAFITDAAGLDRALASGHFTALAGLEGAHGIEGSLDHLRAAFEHGLRMLGLVHFQANEAAFPMTSPAFDGRGLTGFGFELLAECERLGLVVDLAHLNRSGVDDALARARRPLVVSHSACAGVHAVSRNLTDDQIRAVADHGGVMGLAVGRDFLGPGGLDAFVAHANHARDVGGEDVVAIGSDWDGAIIPAPDLEDVRGLPHLTRALLDAGWKPDPLRKLLGGNALRVLREVLA
jgi:membrane dipeptidase